MPSFTNLNLNEAKILKMTKLGTKKIVIIAVAVAFSFLITFSLQENFAQNQNYSYDGIPRAAIIDQLHDDIPSPYFQDKASDLLETAGYEVELFTTEQLTVDFYKTLPSMNYEFIVFRTHAIGNDALGKEPVSLFTGEKYRDDKYISEQLAGLIGKGAPYMSSILDVSADLSGLNDSNNTSLEIDMTQSLEQLVDDSNPYFLVGSKYVDDVMEGRFQNSVLVLGGCSTLSDTSLAESLIRKGASAVIGWDALVGSNQNDQVMLELLENVLINNMDIKDAVKSEENKDQGYSKFNPNLLFYDGTE